MLGMLIKLLKALNSEASPWQLAFAIAFGLIVGLTPLYSVHNLLFVLLVFMLRVNLTAFFAATGFFSLIAYISDTLSIQIGEYLLGAPGLQRFWTELYQSEFWQITHFNHTLTLGSLVLTLILFIPVAVVSKILIVTYRHRFMAWFGKIKIVGMLKTSKFYQLYNTFAD